MKEIIKTCINGYFLLMIKYLNNKKMYKMNDIY